MSDIESFADQPKAPEQPSSTEKQTEPAAVPGSAILLDAKTGAAGTGPAPVSTNKNIVVCCDGTGNEFASKESRDSNSNVVKLYTALNLDGNQIAYYHPGVGTLGNPAKTGVAKDWSVVKGLAFGEGFEENVLDAYRYLMQHYNSGDRVFIFGFSRGSYTARALAGLLHGYGLLCRGNESHIPYAWRTYTEHVAAQQDQRSIQTDFSFRDTFSHRDFIMHFVGLWDTVSAVGWISTPLRLLHLAQNPSIIRGRHAISIDERRTFYQDNLWGPPIEIQIPKCRKVPGEIIPKVQDIVQVWFSGVHSDVGGSYPQLTSGLSNITLRWMIDEARKADVHMNEERVKMVLGEKFNADEADPQHQLALLYEQPTSSDLHKSLNLPWWPLEIFPHRYFDRDDVNPKMRIPLGARRRLPKGAIVHPSVFTRLSDPCYRPRNLAKEELQPLQRSEWPEGTISDLSGFYRFVPTRCREGGWREQWAVVFLVTLLEVAIGFFVAWKLLVGLAYVTDWLLQASIWTRRHDLPRTDFSWLEWIWQWTWHHLQLSITGQRLRLLHRFWPFLLAFVVVIAGFTKGVLKRFK